MTLTRVAVLLVLWGVALSSLAQSQATENARSQEAAERSDAPTITDKLSSTSA